MNQTSKSLFDRIGGRETLAVLLRHFYADVRQHQLIGPIFNQHIHDWPAHLAKVGEFWARLTGGPSDFVGSLPFKHAGLGLDARHFDVWLGLWEANCQCYVAPPRGRGNGSVGADDWAAAAEHPRQQGDFGTSPVNRRRARAPASRLI